MGFLTLHSNLVGRPKLEVFQGRKYFVFPTRIMRQGVMNGSGGRVLYLVGEMRKFCNSWNQKPIVVNHPKDEDGEYISADDPEILDEFGVGFIRRNRIEKFYGDHFKNYFQNAQSWVDPLRLKKVDYDALQMIKEGLNVEVSTGLFSDTERKKGEFHGERYTRIARDYNPDHLALLPNLVGACSIDQGCGMFTASEAVSPTRMRRIQKMLTQALREKKVKTNCSCGGHGKQETSDMKTTIRKRVDALVASKAYDKNDRKWLAKLAANQLDKMIAVTKKTKKVKTNKEDDDEDEEDEESKKKTPKANSKKGETRRERFRRLKLSNAKKKKEQRKKDIKANKKADKTPILRLNTIADVKKHTSGPVREALFQAMKITGAERKRLVNTITANENSQFDEDDLKDPKIWNLKRLRQLANSLRDKEEEGDESDFLGRIGEDFEANDSKGRHKEEALLIPELFGNEEKKSKKK